MQPFKKSTLMDENKRSVDTVKEIMVSKILDKMLLLNPSLYEEILDSNLAYYFNELVKLAAKS